MTTHGMVDIETTDVKPTAVVLTVGAVKFDPFTFDEPYEKRHWKLEVDRQSDAGRTTDDTLGGTMDFWGKQSPEVQDAAFGPEDRVTLETFFKEYNKWMVSVSQIWAHHPQFDLIILKSLYDQFDHHYNWPFWAEQDSASLFNRMKKSPLKGVNNALHNAAEDAYWQAKCVQIVYDHFKFVR
jgi:hypothetical protein